MKDNKNTYWFIFVGNSLLLTNNEGDNYSIPFSEEAPVALKEWTYVQELPDIDGYYCKAFRLTVPPININKFIAVGLRESYSKLPFSMYSMASKASELLFWNANTKYCGVCGAPMKKDTEISKRCTNCGKEVWPQLATAIIVLVHRVNEGREEVLLVHARNFRSDFYGLVAGFVETGETLEEAVHREVKEETGLSITNLRYFGSQPWPYPCGLMVGFHADYLSGEVHLQKEELSKGDWFDKNHLPQIPEKLSIARKLIDDWLGSFK